VKALRISRSFFSQFNCRTALRMGSAREGRSQAQVRAVLHSWRKEAPGQVQNRHSPIRNTARGRMWAALSVHFVLKTKMEMPLTFSRVRCFFLYCNGNIATV
jgi:hypothetical protein